MANAFPAIRDTHLTLHAAAAMAGKDTFASLPKPTPPKRFVKTRALATPEHVFQTRGSRRAYPANVLGELAVPSARSKRVRPAVRKFVKMASVSATTMVTSDADAKLVLLEPNAINKSTCANQSPVSTEELAFRKKITMNASAELALLVQTAAKT